MFGRPFPRLGFPPALIIGTLCALTLAGCFPAKRIGVLQTALIARDVAGAAARQPDVDTVREGAPAYLMLIDGLIASYPDDPRLLVAGCQAYAGFASTFLGEGERERAGLLYGRAKAYGFKALSRRADFQAVVTGNPEELASALGAFRKEDAPALFWSVSAWAGWLSSNPTSVEALGDLPAFEATLARLMELDEGYYQGGPHLLMGAYLASKPAVAGGNLEAARKHFDRAFALGAEKSLAARVMFAQYYAIAARDRDLFTRTLEGVLAEKTDADPDLIFSNAVARRTARRLLDKAEETFGDPL